MDKQEELSRMQFEGWVKNQYSCKGNTLLRVGPNKERYRQVVIQECWEAWQGSRASIVVELEDKVMVEDEFDKGHNCAIDYCAERIRSIGLSIKGEE